MNLPISRKYLMSLIKQINEAIYKEYNSSKDIEHYVRKWQKDIDNLNFNFQIVYNSYREMLLDETLHNIDEKTLLEIAVDMGIETPDFIPSIATFRNEIKSDYKTASATFEKALKQIETHPDIAISLSNSALESIIKEILKDKRINSDIKSTETLYVQASGILKIFQLFPNSEMPIEIKTIGSSLLAATQSIEKLRSEKTHVHGKTQDDYIVEDSLYTYFIINSVTTVGLFLNSYYKNKFPKPEPEIDNTSFDDLPF